ncbi:MAG: hypothetical protein OXG65_16820 [Chloroflexi bacterium]|nr:hypothetical protein [Chloroflexota bacterium]
MERLLEPDALGIMVGFPIVGVGRISMAGGRDGPCTLRGAVGTMVERD